MHRAITDVENADCPEVLGRDLRTSDRLGERGASPKYLSDH